VWFALANFRWANQSQAFDAVLLAALVQRFQCGFFARLGGYHQLAGTPVRDMVLFAKSKCEWIALQAMARFERAGRIVNSRVNYAAIARAGSHAYTRKALHDEDILPLFGKLGGYSAANYSTADN
jgi:hypothetical protein